MYVLNIAMATRGCREVVGCVLYIFFYVFYQRMEIFIVIGLSIDLLSFYGCFSTKVGNKQERKRGKGHRSMGQDLRIQPMELDTLHGPCRPSSVTSMTSPQRLSVLALIFSAMRKTMSLLVAQILLQTSYLKIYDFHISIEYGKLQKIYGNFIIRKILSCLLTYEIGSLEKHL